MRNQRMDSQSHSFRKGFTLIELLVVFSVVSILAGIGFASFVSYSRSQQVNQTANNIKLLINEGKFNALSSVKTVPGEDGAPESCNDNDDTLSGYSIGPIGTDGIELRQICAAAGSTRVKSINFPTNVVLTAATTCTQISFDSLGSTVGGAPCNFVLSGFGETKTITIDALGNVSIQ